MGNGADPSATGKALAFQRPDRAGVLRFRGQIHQLPGRDPAVGGPYVAVISGGDQIQISPPFIISEAEIDELVGGLDEVLTEVAGSLAAQPRRSAGRSMGPRTP